MVKERDMINQKFSMNPKTVYRKFKADKEISVENPPSKESMESFWKNIWVQNNSTTRMLIGSQNLKDYCKNVEPKEYELTSDVLNKIFNKTANNKAPGRDKILCTGLRR